MPTYQGQITEDGLIDLVEYIKSMSPTNDRLHQTLVNAESRQNVPTTPTVVK
jgi:cytochrome c oxidase subunit 2